MALRDPIGIWFSELKDNWEERDFYHERIRDRKTYRHYGDLPDGLCYGTVYFEGSDPWPPSACVTVTDKEGKSLCNSAVSENWKTWKWQWPDMLAASPSGKSLVCQIDGRIYAWRKDKEGFVSDLGDFLDGRIGDLKVLDAKIQDDGILQLKMEDGTLRGYLCDANAVLSSSSDSWIADNDESWIIADACKNGYLESCPEAVAIVISDSDNWGQYENCGIHKAFVEQGTKRIEGCVLAENPELKTMTIPASVEYIEWGAFLNCRNLQELLIEGDLSRVSDWNEGAFNGCPCEEYYLSLCNKNR